MSTVVDISVPGVNEPTFFRCASGVLHIHALLHCVDLLPDDQIIAIMSLQNKNLRVLTGILLSKFI